MEDFDVLKLARGLAGELEAKLDATTGDIDLTRDQGLLSFALVNALIETIEKERRRAAH